MEYQVVIDCETDSLCETVAELMAEGRMPQGGVAVVVETWEGGGESQVSYCQAMVRGSYQAIQAHDLQPGSVVVVSVDRRIAPADRMQLQADFTALLPEGVTGTVLLEGARITDVFRGE